LISDTLITDTMDNFNIALNFVSFGEIEFFRKIWEKW